MSRSRKLELVRPGAASQEPAADRAAAAAEQPRARCRELVRAAARHPELDPVDHELLLALTLGEQQLELGEARRERASAFGDGLDQLFGARSRCGAADVFDSGRDEELVALGELAQALRAAACSGELDELAHERLLRRALEAPARRTGAARWSAAAAMVAAVAAGVALFWSTLQQPADRRAVTAQPSRRSEPAAQSTPLIRSRSTQALFDPAVPFPPRGGESARVDRIAHARAAELRANRFAMWGVH